MRLDQNPVFRKVIVPWYDSETACFTLMAIMGVVFLFGLVGLSVARETPDHHDHIWVPISLLLMSGGVIISLAIRLGKRYLHRFSK